MVGRDVMDEMTNGWKGKKIEGWKDGWMNTNEKNIGGW